MTALAWNVLDPDAPGGYLPTKELRDLVNGGEMRQSWWLAARLMSVEIGKRHVYKSSDRFRGSPSVLDALEARGVYHPSSFGDCYHQLAPHEAPVRTSFNKALARWSGGPWEEALQPGVLTGTWYHYDITSAYHWASTLGLPDPDTYRVEKRQGSRPGVWVADLPAREDLPPCHRRGGWCVVTSEELEAYKLAPRIRYGITWDRAMRSDFITQTLNRLPPGCAKQAGRAYWGVWAGRDPLVRLMASGKRIAYKNFRLNLPRAWLIVARVRLRLWQNAGGAAHVYVDEMVTRDQFRTGEGLGDWRCKAIYTGGIIVERTGFWRTADGHKIIMQTGVSRGKAA